jgi:glutathione peroxidase
VLVINTATKCGLTPQFEGLEKLHQTYKDKGLVILGFPCNQFASQEPETNESIVEACLINHGVTFQLTEKVDVNGKNTHPVYEYLKKEKGGFLGSKIKWNFTKFLVNKEGKVLKRYSPTTTPDKIADDIEKSL